MTLICHGESDSTLILIELNASVTPQGNIISLTEEDFKMSPKLVPVIRDKKQKPIQRLENGSSLYMIPLDETYDYYPLVGKILEH
jgi:hypothetical protein